ncbi:structural constituent of cell wall [Rhizoctonia solani]|uniref:Structural constituent of cell wall n=1 Tax=Rhizoctonia solani TaxID=456999 RepID=A0A8H8NMJ2_9AGAM|nr:structural constituent of cell wall [Rhizoctonia solani]QRW16531.1 structural constituent of cell wall [Rhizoctonia solani]
MSDAGSPLQLRDSMRKMRKRSRTGSEEGEKLSNQSHRDESEHEHEHDEHEQEHEQELEHTPSHTNPNSATSSTHSLSRSAGSRPASPSPSTDKVQRKRSLVNLSFPRSPRKNKSKGESTPSSPHTRIRTFSSPDAPDGTPALGSEPGKLTVPIPARPRTLSHPLATSPIMPSSPDKDTDNTRPKSGHSRAASSPGTGAFGALASAASTLAAMAATHPGSLPTSKSPGPSPPPSVVLTPPAAETSTSLPTQIVESPITHPAPSEQPSSAPDVINTPDIPIVDGPKAEELDQPRDKADQDTSQREQPTVTPLIEREQPREPSSQGREPLPREQGHVGVRRAASAVGSEMGWSVLEPPQEEDETEEDVGAGKVEQEKQVQVRVEEVVPSIAPSAVDVREPSNAEQVVELEDAPAKAEVASLETQESGVKVEKDDVPEETTAEHGSLLLSPAPPAVDERKPLSATHDGQELHNGTFVMSPEGTEQNTPQQPSLEPTSEGGFAGIFVDTPPREVRPTWISSVSTPPRAASPEYPEFAVPTTPPAQAERELFNPDQFSTPENRRTFKSSTSPGSSQFSDTPSKFTDLNLLAIRLSTSISTPPRPHEESYYPGDATPPPPSMSESFFHPRNLEKLSPNRLERSMSTMGVFGDADPDGASVQERLQFTNPGHKPSLDTSVHEMISPSVQGEENELRKLAGTELKDWYESEKRTPKTVRMMLPETERAIASNGAGPRPRPRSMLSQVQVLEPAAEIQESEASKTVETDEAQPTTRVRHRASASQDQVQRQPEREVYTSVLSRLMSHMDRRSSLMSRLATRLGTLGGVGGPLPVEKHPREWVAQTLPSGKIYYAHRLVVDEIDLEDTPGTKPRAVTPAAEGSTTKVLVIPTPSAPQPVTLVTDLDMSDPVTHSGVNSFVDKNLQERDIDLPSGWEIWIHASGTSESLFDGSKADRWDEVSEAGSEPVDLGYGAPCVLVWTYVSHKRRRVGAQGPEDKLVTGEDAEHDLEMERRYWAYVETTRTCRRESSCYARSYRIANLALYDRFLAEKKRGEKEVIHVEPPFTPEESQEVLEFFKSVTSDYSHANAVLKTRTVAVSMSGLVTEWRLAKLHAVADAVNLDVMSPSERLRRRRAAANPFVGVPLRTLASLLGLGIPYLYVEQPDGKRGCTMACEHDRLITAFKSALMLGASVSFLAIPDLEDIARLAGVAAACSLGSLAAGIVRLRLPSFSSGKEGGEGTDDEEQEPRPSALRTFARSLPLVLSAYAGSALVAGLAAYSWRGQVSTVDDPFTGLYPYDSRSQDSLGGRWLRSFVRGDRVVGDKLTGSSSTLGHLVNQNT